MSKSLGQIRLEQVEIFIDKYQRDSDFNQEWLHCGVGKVFSVLSINTIGMSDVGAIILDMLAPLNRIFVVEEQNYITTLQKSKPTRIKHYNCLVTRFDFDLYMQYIKLSRSVNVIGITRDYIWKKIHNPKITLQSILEYIVSVYESKYEHTQKRDQSTHECKKRSRSPVKSERKLVDYTDVLPVSEETAKAFIQELYDEHNLVKTSTEILHQSANTFM